MAALIAFRADLTSGDEANSAPDIPTLEGSFAQLLEKTLNIGITEESGTIAIVLIFIVISESDRIAVFGSFLFSHCPRQPFVGADFDAVVAVPASDLLTSGKSVGTFAHDLVISVSKCIH